MGRKRLAMAAVAALALLLSGCLRAVQLEYTGRRIAAEYPDAQFHREFSVALGSLPLGLIKMVVSLDDANDEDLDALRGVHSIELVVYEVDKLRPGDRVHLPRDMARLLRDDGWETMVKANEKDELAMVLYRQDGDIIRDLYVVSLDEEELVLVRLSGRLNTLFEQAQKDDHKLTSMVGRARKRVASNGADHN